MHPNLPTLTDINVTNLNTIGKICFFGNYEFLPKNWDMLFSSIFWSIYRLCFGRL